MVLFQAINEFANPNSRYGLAGIGRRRRLFIPPSTNRPLFIYGYGDDQRSFLSMIESGSVYTDEESEASEVASVSTSRSLPSTLVSGGRNADQESFHSWLLEEHQRRYSAANSEEEDNLEEEEEEDEEEGEGMRRSLSTHMLSGASLMSLEFYSEYEDFINLKTTYLIELRMLAKYSAPLIITFVLEHFFSIVCLLVVGHLGKNELAAVSLGTMSSTITYAMFEGIATALDTLCPQAYGAGNFELVSVHVQRCTLFSLILYVPCAVVWWYSSTLLKYLIDSEEVLELTQLFLRWMIPGAPAYIIFENAKRFLQAQGIFEAGPGILFLSATINIFLSWTLVWNSTVGIGFVGAPIATVVNFWLMDIFLVLYVVYIDGLKCWFGLSSLKQLLQEWSHLSHLALPGILMLESEYMAYEIMTLFASYLGTTELAAQSAVLSIASLTYMVPFAVSIASSTRIANFIGGQNLYSVEIATNTGLLASIAVSAINCVALFVFKGQIARLFTTDAGVIALVILLFNPLVSVVQIFDGIASVASGILRAQGRQKIGGLINFLAYYAFAIPLAIVLSKSVNLGLYGLWIGIGCGMLMIGLTETFVILTGDWENILLEAGLMNQMNLEDDDQDDSFA